MPNQPPNSYSPVSSFSLSSILRLQPEIDSPRIPDHHSLDGSRTHRSCFSHVETDAATAQIWNVWRARELPDRGRAHGSCSVNRTFHVWSVLLPLSTDHAGLHLLTVYPFSMDISPLHPLDGTNHRRWPNHDRNILRHAEHLLIHPVHLPSICSIDLCREQSVEESICVCCCLGYSPDAGKIGHWWWG